MDSIGTLVPVNMKSAVRDSLQSLSDRVGSLDTFVADALGMPVDTLGEYFAAEQVDALALALDNFNKGSGFIIGDQTGGGKGRVVAGVIRYAIQQGRTPIFVTEKMNLYADMYRDLNDIGFGNIKMLMTNSNETVALDDEGQEVLKTPKASVHQADLARVAETGDLGQYDVIFTTYSQMQAVKKQRTVRMDLLERFSDGGVIIFDESHNAGGTGTSGSDDARSSSDSLNRAKIARDLAGQAHSVLYSSATYAKRPDVMDLYFRTDMSKAVPDISDLPEAIKAGGVPLQQVVASMLVRAGQYVRRERSFKGVLYDTVPVNVDTGVAERVSQIMSSVHMFDQAKKKSVKDIKKEAAQAAKRVGASTAVGEAGMHSTNFTSVLHNLIDQMLLSLKMDATVEQADAAIKDGRKPVITLSNTMGSFVKDFVKDLGLNPGEPISLSFGDLLNRYLEKSREVSIRESEGAKESTKYRLTDSELGAEGVRLYKEAKSLIESLDLSNMPVSPIDYLRSRLEQRGYSTSEITGRTEIIDYSESVPVYRNRPAKEVSVNGRRTSISKFNSGKTDVIILNQAGSTGISLHAHKKFKDQRQREMIIAQSEKNIDTHMQMLGRVHRAGQVVAPVYRQLVANIPAEKRPASVLAKKMASLNANTTASRGSDLTAENVPDFMNEYGDQVATQVMADNPEWHRAMGLPIDNPDPADVSEGAIAKVTGRIPLLPIAQQEQLYQVLESEYSDLLEQLEASGVSPLEAKTLDLDARTIKEEIVYSGDPESDSPFADDAIAETVDMKRTGKPMTWGELHGELKSELGVESDSTAALKTAGREQMSEKRRAAEADFEAHLQEATSEASTPEAATKIRENLNQKRDLFGERANTVIPGATVVLSTDGGPMQGVVLRVESKGKTSNPLALSDWRAVIAVTDAQRKMTVPFSQMGKSENASVMIKRSPKRLEQMEEEFNEAASQSREERVIITRNLLAGYGQFSSGQIINFIDSQGNTREGILMPKRFNLQEKKAAKPVEFAQANEVIEFLDGDISRMVESRDGDLVIRRINDREYMLEVPSSKRRGGRFFLNEVLLGAAQSEFIKSGSSMRMRVTKPNIEDTIRSLIASNPLITKTSKDEARQITGQEVPGEADLGRASLSRPGDMGAERAQGRGEQGSLEGQGVTVSESQGAADDLMGGWQGAPSVLAVQSEADFPEGLTRWVAEQGATGVVEAVYWRNRVYVVVNKMRSVQQVREKVLHEVVGHHGLRKLVGRDLGRVLNRVWAMHGRSHRDVRDIINRYFKGDRKFDVNNRAHRDLVAEELIAQMAERGTNASLVQRAVSAVRDWLRRMGWDLRMNESDMANLVRRARRVAENGGVSTESPSAMGQDEAAASRGEAGADLPDTIEVDGSQRPTRNSEGRVIHPTEEGVRNFWRWFEGSQTVDESGRPVPLYHGTTSDVSTFDAGEIGTSSGNDGYYGAGFYFSASTKMTDPYASGAGGNVMPSYVRIENPKVFTDHDGVEGRTEMIASLEGWSSQEREAIRSGRSVIGESIRGSRFTEVLRQNGFDGVLVDGWRFADGGATEAVPLQEVVAFDSDQIKSAVGNRGTFDGDSDDTRFSLTDPDKFKNKPPKESGPVLERHAKTQRAIFDGRPVEWAFRIPFILTGQVDSSGNWKPGKKLERGVKHAIQTWKPNPDGAFGWMNGILETARAGIIDRHGLDRDFVQREFAAQAEQTTIEGLGEQFVKTLASEGVGPKEAIVLQKILNGEDVGEQNMRELAQPIREAIDELGQELVSLGFLKAETYHKNLGKYLHISYMKYEQRQEGLPKWARHLMRKHRRKIHGDELKARGLKEDVTMDRLFRDAPADWWGRKITKGKADEQLVNTEWRMLDLVRFPDEGSFTLGGIDAGEAKGRVIRRVFWPADVAIPESMNEYTDRGTWRVSGTAKGGKLRLRRDFTKEERESMGVILDARYNIIKTFQVMSHDIANGKFFRDIANNPEWAVKEPPGGDSVATPKDASRFRTFAEVDWVKVPNTKVTGTSAYQWGALADMHVRPEIWRDLNEMDRMQHQGTWGEILTQWKKNKTARSPVVHMNNVMSNFILMDLIDVRMQDLVRGLAEYRKKGDWYVEARDNGAFGAGFVRKELNRNTINPILDEILSDARNERDTVEGRTRLLSKMGYKLWNLAKTGDRKMVDFYQTEDELFRMATFMRHRSMGASAVEAAEIARDQFLNYDIRAPWVNAARATVVPFISYTYRAVPAIAQAIAHRPWKLAKYITIGYLANMLAFELEPGDEDEERRTMRDYQQGMTWASIPFTDIGIHRMMRLPWKDEHDNPYYLDVYRWIPASDVFDTNQGQMGVPAWLQFGGPMQLAFEMMINRSAFTGRDIVNRDIDTTGEAAGKRFDYLWKAWMPSAAYVPGSWHYDKLSRAISGERDMLDRPYSVTAALASGVGIKAQPHDVELGYYFRGSDIERKLRALKGEARNIQRDAERGIGSEGQRSRDLQRIEEKIERLEEDARRLQGSQ